MADNNAPVRVLVWDEAPTHAPKSLYPKSLNGAIADGLNEMGGGKHRRHDRQPGRSQIRASPTRRWPTRTF